MHATCARMRRAMYSSMSGLSPSSRGVVSLAVRASGELMCALIWSLGVLTEPRSHYATTRRHHWCGATSVGAT
eukprot:2722161-Prymnesium_polylepis.1